MIRRSISIRYLSADLQIPELFLERKPLSEGAKRAGWQGFHHHLDSFRDRLIPIAEGRLPRPGSLVGRDGRNRGEDGLVAGRFAGREVDLDKLRLRLAIVAEGLIEDGAEPQS